jgi:hypothetical protein
MIYTAISIHRQEISQMFDPNRFPFTKQIIIDLTKRDWAKYVEEQLTKIIAETSDHETQELLRHWVVSFKTYSIPEIINTMNEELKKPDSVLITKSSFLNGLFFSPHYIIDALVSSGLRRDPGASYLCRKWDSRHPDNPCVYLFEKDFLAANNSQSLGTDSDNLRIYIFVHGSINSNYLKGYDFPLDKVTNALSHIVGNQQAVVNLVSCGAGRDNSEDLADDKGHDSFAAKLHADLYFTMKRDIPVVARNSNVYLSYRKYTGESYFSAQHQQPGSKIIFTIDNKSNQVRLDAYYFRLKNKICRQLQLLINLENINPLRKELLQNWLITFSQKMPEEILKLMTSELNNPDSVLNEKVWQNFLRFSSVTITIKALITESTKIIYSPLTMTQPVLTGRIFFSSSSKNNTIEAASKLADKNLKKNK